MDHSTFFPFPSFPSVRPFPKDELKKKQMSGAEGACAPPSPLPPQHPQHHLTQQQPHATGGTPILSSRRGSLAIPGGGGRRASIGTPVLRVQAVAVSSISGAGAGASAGATTTATAAATDGSSRPPSPALGPAAQPPHPHGGTPNAKPLRVYDSSLRGSFNLGLPMMMGNPPGPTSPAPPHSLQQQHHHHSAAETSASHAAALSPLSPSSPSPPPQVVLLSARRQSIPNLGGLSTLLCCSSRAHLFFLPLVALPDFMMFLPLFFLSFFLSNWGRSTNQSQSNPKPRKTRKTTNNNNSASRQRHGVEQQQQQQQPPPQRGVARFWSNDHGAPPPRRRRLDNNNSNNNDDINKFRGERRRERQRRSSQPQR